MRRRRQALNLAKGALHRLGVVVGALALTLVFFLVLPVMQAISAAPESDLIVTSFDVANLPPPPPPPEEEIEEEPEEEPPPPELNEEAAPLDLSQLELALNPGLSGGLLGGDFAVKLNTVNAAAGDVDELFNVSDLDQPPQVYHQPSPVLTPALRSRTPAKVIVVFDVDERGQVVRAKVDRSTDAAFDRSAIDAVKQYKFKPAKRNGKVVPFKMRRTISYPAR